jgi:hypothetical protein
MKPGHDAFSSGADMPSRTRNGRPTALRIVATLALCLAAETAQARLSVIPGGRPTPRPTSSSTAPTPSPTIDGSATIAGCQALIASESARMLADVRTALGTCLTRGARCLVDEAGSSACCEESALQCQADLGAIAAATRRFRDTIRGGACGALPFDRLLDDAGLGFDPGACGSLAPAVVVTDHATFADCVQLLMTKDVLHQVALTDVPRAAEALVCMGLDDVLAGSLGEQPATCLPTPSPMPSPSPVPTNSPTPGPPTPIPTPSPGEGGCQPRRFGPCNDGTFTTCCSADQACIAIFSPSDGSGYCTAATPAPTASPTPTVAPSPTATAASATPTPGPTATAPPATPTPTVGATPAPTGSPTQPTATATAAASCSTATVTIRTSYQAQAAPDFVAGVTTMLRYPGGVLDIPGTGNQSTVLARVTNLSGANGLFSAGDQDSDQSGTDDLLSVGMISTGSAVPAGDFARVVFDCVAGQPVPTAGDFSCTPDVSSLFGNTVDATCSITLATAG